MIKLYHGSIVDIDHIDLLKSRPNKDFGRGFYLSADFQQAWRMGEFKALTEGGTPVMNTFLFDEQVLSSNELRVLIFDGYSREWADFIFLNRNNNAVVSGKKNIKSYALDGKRLRQPHSPRMRLTYRTIT